MATTLQMGSILQKAEYPKDRGRDQKRYTEKCTAFNATAALEAYRFPMYMGAKSQILTDWKKRERGFFNSLSYLESLYDFKTIEESDFPYPQNVKIALDMARRKLRGFDPRTQIAILSTEDNPSFLVTYMTLKTEYDFYHLPLQPLTWLRSQKKYKAEADLLVSICAYIYKGMDVDLFCDEGSHVYYQMELLKECMEQDGDEAIEGLVYDVENAFRQGSILRTEFLKKSTLAGFAARVRRYKPKDEKSEQLLAIAKAALYLHQHFPTESISESMRYSHEFDGADDMDHTPFNAYRRLSFIWDMDTELFDQVWEMLRNEMDAVDVYNEPLTFQFFKEPQAKIELSLAFQEKAFELLGLIGDFLINDIWTI
jgi:hypothetical protein